MTGKGIGPGLAMGKSSFVDTVMSSPISIVITGRDQRHLHCDKGALEAVERKRDKTDKLKKVRMVAGGEALQFSEREETPGVIAISQNFDFRGLRELLWDYWRG